MGADRSGPIRVATAIPPAADLAELVLLAMMGRMQEVPGGPELERLRRVMEQQRDETDRELRDGPPFPARHPR